MGSKVDPAAYGAQPAFGMSCTCFDDMAHSLHWVVFFAHYGTTYGAQPAFGMSCNFLMKAMRVIVLDYM